MGAGDAEPLCACERGGPAAPALAASVPQLLARDGKPVQGQEWLDVLDGGEVRAEYGGKAPCRDHVGVRAAPLRDDTMDDAVNPVECRLEHAALDARLR